MSILSRIRRNHGLEHASIHVLSETQGNFSAQGNSDHRGFHLNIYGDIAEEAVETADALLIDALKLPEIPLPQRALKKGDLKSLTIAAARPEQLVDHDEGTLVVLDHELEEQSLEFHAAGCLELLHLLR